MSRRRPRRTRRRRRSTPVPSRTRRSRARPPAPPRTPRCRPPSSGFPLVRGTRARPGDEPSRPTVRQSRPLRSVPMGRSSSTVAVEERHRRGRFLGRSVDRDRPHARQSGGGEQPDEIRGPHRPGPLATLRVTELAAQPVVVVAPTAARQSQQRRARRHREVVELLARNLFAREPRRNVRAEQPSIERADHVVGCTTIRLLDRSSAKRSVPVDEHAASRTATTTTPAKRSSTAGHCS